MSTLTNINDNPAAQADDGHDFRGRFKAGNPGGPGNPYAGKVARIRRMMFECITEDDLKAIIQSLLEMAKEGHWQAAKLILGYMLGKPQAASQDFAISESEIADLLGASLPSTNGNSTEPPPSTNGESPEAPPSANGELQEAPSTNDISPPRNRAERRALRKAYRLAKQERNTPKPASVD